MKKTEIEIIRYEDHIQGYCVVDKGFDDQSVLDAIVEFSKDKNITVYRHYVKQEFVPYEPPKYYKVKDLNIPMGTLIFKLVIYYQWRKDWDEKRIKDEKEKEIERLIKYTKSGDARDLEDKNSFEYLNYLISDTITAIKWLKDEVARKKEGCNEI